MSAEHTALRVLIGPRALEDRICRLVYRHETDEAWTEEWQDRAWVRAQLLARHLLKAPPVAGAALARFGIPNERGVLDLELAAA